MGFNEEAADNDWTDTRWTEERAQAKRDREYGMMCDEANDRELAEAAAQAASDKAYATKEFCEHMGLACEAMRTGDVFMAGKHFGWGYRICLTQDLGSPFALAERLSTAVNEAIEIAIRARLEARCVALRGWKVLRGGVLIGHVALVDGHWEATVAGHPFAMYARWSTAEAAEAALRRYAAAEEQP